MEEHTIWDKIVNDDNLSIIKKNFLKIKDYRNDVMHAHNISYENFNKAKLLFEKVNSKLEEENNKMVEFPENMNQSADYNNAITQMFKLLTEEDSNIFTSSIENIIKQLALMSLKELDQFKKYSNVD